MTLLLERPKTWKNCALELYCNLTTAQLIRHLLFYARAYLRKDNSWSTGIIFTVFKIRQIAHCDKHRDLGKVINTWNDDQFNLTQKIQHPFQCITSTIWNGWKRSMFILQNLFGTANPSQNIFSQRQKENSFWETSFQLMATEIVKINVHYPNIQIPWKAKLRFFLKIPIQT